MVKSKNMVMQSLLRFRNTYAVQIGHFIEEAFQVGIGCMFRAITEVRRRSIYRTRFQIGRQHEHIKIPERINYSGH